MIQTQPATMMTMKGKQLSAEERDISIAIGKLFGVILLFKLIMQIFPYFFVRWIIEPEMVVKSAQSVNKIIVQFSYFITGDEKQLFAHGYRCAA